MEAHNLIIKCDRCIIPDSNNLTEFLHERLENPKVDYFGGEIDNPIDYVDELMVNEINNTTFITFHFDHPVDIDQETALGIIRDAVKDGQIQHHKSDEKDIEIVLL